MANEIDHTNQLIIMILRYATLHNTLVMHYNEWTGRYLNERILLYMCVLDKANDISRKNASIIFI